MESYLQNIQYAATKVFEAIYHETDELLVLIQKRQQALLEAREALPSKLKAIDQKIEKLTDNIAFHEASERILCGSILQFAKQGISLIHRHLDNCPPGRKVGSQDLKEVIWQTRNHAMHHEESPNHNQRVLDCFSELEADFGVQFSLQAHPGVNLSKEVIQALSWHGFMTFSEDMLTLS